MCGSRAKGGMRVFLGDKGRFMYWILLGISIGFGLLTKYAMALFYLCSFFFLLSRERRLFFTKGPYIAFFISLLIFSPVILSWLGYIETYSRAGTHSRRPEDNIKRFLWIHWFPAWSYYSSSLHTYVSLSLDSKELQRRQFPHLVLYSCYYLFSPEKSSRQSAGELGTTRVCNWNYCLFCIFKKSFFWRKGQEDSHCDSDFVISGCYSRGTLSIHS